MHRTWGGIAAGAFFVIPSIFILLGLSYIYAAYGNVPLIAGVLDGFKPVVVAIVVEALLKIGGRALKREIHYAIAALAFISIYFLHVAFPLIVLAAGLIGLIGTKYLPASFDAEQEKKSSTKLPEESDMLPLISTIPPLRLNTRYQAESEYLKCWPSALQYGSIGRIDHVERDDQPAHPGIPILYAVGPPSRSAVLTRFSPTSLRR
ncbi:MAG: chromate transporter [Pyrinomonadaceae bacterium]